MSYAERPRGQRRHFNSIEGSWRLGFESLTQKIFLARQNLVKCFIYSIRSNGGNESKSALANSAELNKYCLLVILIFTVFIAPKSRLETLTSSSRPRRATTTPTAAATATATTTTTTTTITAAAGKTESLWNDFVEVERSV